MFRRHLLRQARACRVVRASPSSLLTVRTGAAPRPSIAPRPATLAASISRVISARAYSSASAAAETQDGQNQDGRITRFADLEALDVHQSLIRAIVDDMGYETMTDVQSMSITPALKGKDMYVAQLGLATVPVTAPTDFDFPTALRRPEPVRARPLASYSQ